MKKQRGFSLAALLLGGFIVLIITVFVVKILPDLVEFYKIKKSVASTVKQSYGLQVEQIRNVYSKYAEVEHIRVIDPQDLDIYKQGETVVISFAYEKRIKLTGNVSLLIDFSGRRSARDR